MCFLIFNTVKFTFFFFSSLNTPSVHFSIFIRCPWRPETRPTLFRLPDHTWGWTRRFAEWEETKESAAFAFPSGTKDQVLFFTTLSSCLSFPHRSLCTSENKGYNTNILGVCAQFHKLKTRRTYWPSLHNGNFHPLQIAWQEKAAESPPAYESQAWINQEGATEATDWETHTAQKPGLQIWCYICLFVILSNSHKTL